MSEPVDKSRITGKWQYSYKGRAHGSYNTKREAAIAYVNNLVEKEPKYKPLFEGKSWAHIFKIISVSV